MTQRELENRFNKAYLESLDKPSSVLNDNFFDKIIVACNIMYGKYLNVFKYEDMLEVRERQFSEDSEKDFSEEITQKIKRINEKLIPHNSLLNIVEYLDRNKIPFIKGVSWNSVYVITEDFIAFSDGFYDTNPWGCRSKLRFGAEELKLPEWIDDCLEFHNGKKKNKCRYVVHSSNGFSTKDFKINDMETDLSLNYNDNLPNETIEKFIKDDNAGIAIFHGEPGTGKSTYIRYLIGKFPDKDFLYLDASCFNYITDASFIKLLMDYQDSVLILEDSEKLLQKREDSHANMSTLLNMTDGILADSLRLKVICTFNASLEDIDKALLRKGRLKVKYNFEKLNADKVETLCKKIGLENVEKKPMTLADIYNYAEQVDFSEKKKKSVGF